MVPIRTLVFLILSAFAAANVWPAPNHNLQNTRRHLLSGPNSLPVPFCNISPGVQVTSYVVASNNVLLVNLATQGVAAYHLCKQQWLYRTSLLNPISIDNIYLSPDDKFVFVRAMDARQWKVVALRVADGVAAWNAPFGTGGSIQLVGVVDEALLVLVSDQANSFVVGLNLPDGTKLWTRELSTGGSSQSIIGVAPSGYPFAFISAGLNQGNVTAFSAMGEAVWTSWVPFQNAWVAAFAGDVLVVLGDSGLVAIHLDGSPAWACTVCTGTRSANNFAITKDRVISSQWSAISFTNTILALDLTTGAQLWTYRLTNYQKMDPVLVLDKQDRLYALWPQSGSGLMASALTWDNRNGVSVLFENLSVHGVSSVSDVVLGENEMYVYTPNPNVLYQLKPFG